MRHQRADIVHAFLSAEDQISLGNLDGHAMPVIESLWNFRPAAALAALESVIPGPGLRFQSFRDIHNNL